MIAFSPLADDALNAIVCLYLTTVFPAYSIRRTVGVHAYLYVKRTNDDFRIEKKNRKNHIILL